MDYTGATAFKTTVREAAKKNVLMAAQLRKNIFF